MGQQVVYVGLALIAALLLDFGLMRWARRRLRPREEDGPVVRVLGAYSPILTWLRYRRWPAPGRLQPAPIRLERRLVGRFAVEWLIILLVAYFYGGSALLDFDARQLQQSGEHNESATLPLLAEVGLQRYGEIPLWNPYMLTGYPHVGDLINHFWHPVSTIPVWLWGGVNGMKVSVFVAFVLAGWGQWLFTHVMGARGLTRLWSGIMFMISGGLGLLWRVGWYELLLGMAWFPWCFAAFWWALARRDRTSLVLTALCVAMLLTAGGGYYPFYLAASYGVLLIVALLTSPPAERRIKIRRALGIAALSAGLSAVMLAPLLDGYRLTVRDAGSDFEQKFSQPIPYALINYLVAQPEWFNAEILGTAGGWNWFYIGWLPVFGAFTLAPLAFAQSRRGRRALLALFALTIVLLAWHANKHTPAKYLYEWIPFLYTLRFPNRLLILIVSPLLASASLGLTHIQRLARLGTRGWVVAVLQNDGRLMKTGVRVRWFLEAGLALVLLFTARDVYTVNQGFVFAPRLRNPKPFTAISWLKEYDPSLYYINIGGGSIYWDWTPAAYELETPVINFEYGRHVQSMDRQRDEGSPFIATAKYQISLPDQPLPPNARQINDFDGVGVWYDPDALPFAFSAAPAMLQPYAAFDPTRTTALTARFDGPNRVIVEGEAGRAGDQLVVLVSNYPGWRLTVDGKPAPLRPANYYLGADMPAGRHTYVFEFRPPQYYLGAAISLFSLVVTVAAIVSDLPRRAARRQPVPPIPEGMPVA